jgi:hypothetical protein
MKTHRFLIASALGLGFSAGLILTLGSLSYLEMPRVRASQAEPSDTITVCDAGCNYDTIQAAVDGAQEGDTIKVAAGVYSDVSGRPVPPGYMLSPADGVITQVVYISKTVTIQGGYTTTNWNTPDPDAYPTTLDAEGRGRVLFITGDISPTISGLRITGGDDLGLGGWDWRSAQLDAGGGVYINQANTLFEGNIVVDNVSGDGAGIVLIDTPSIVRDNEILSNTAPYGGGMGVYANEPLVENNVIRYNVATDNGAGVFLIETEAILRGNIISDNTATRFGAGLRLRGGNPTFVNNVVVDNQANYGSALYVDGSSARFWHTTFARNGGSSAVSIPERSSPPSTVALTNTIFASHATAVLVGGGNTVPIDGVLWYNNGITVTHAPTATVPVTNQRLGDPVFGPDGYHLMDGSAAEDAGVVTTVALDIDGDPRPCGEYDLGVDERCDQVHLPLVLED